MTIGKTDVKTIHDSWLNYFAITAKQLPEDVRPHFEKMMQGAFYAGAFTVVTNNIYTKEQLWRMCESGLADACGIPSMRLVDDSGKTFSDNHPR